MDKQYFIELTNRIYRLTLLFPQKEALRYKIRGIADEILVDLAIILDGEPKEKREAAFNVERNIDILDVLFELAKKQDWVLGREISEIQEEYMLIKKEVEEFNNISRRESEESSFVQKKETVPQRKDKLLEDVALSKRQEKILRLMSEKGKVQVKDIQDMLPEVTKRTLRRDLTNLLDRSLIKRVGSGNGTYYTTTGNRTLIGQE